jgi:acetyl-CoA C-acetyltransferase
VSYIIDAVRVPIGKAKGMYKNVLPEVLSAFLLKEVLVRNALMSKQIDEVVLANAFGTGGNMARYACLEAGYLVSTSAITIDSQCSGALKTMELGHGLLRSGAAGCVVCGGMESKSLAPEKAYLPHDPRFIRNGKYSVANFSPDQFSDTPLLDAARNVAAEFKISKTQMMAWTVASHKKAVQCMKYISPYIVPFFYNHPHDQALKPQIDLPFLEKVQTNALIDFTNTAHFNDAAAVVLMANSQFVDAQSIPYLAQIVAIKSVGYPPHLAPASILGAIQAVLEVGEFKISDIDLFEINESFAVTPLVFAQEFRVNHQKVNIFGGNLAYGHPFGASGAIHVVHLISALRFSKKKRGLVAIPAAGGLATAMIIEMADVE